ncbi:facilitated trehalose transporter Tret1-like isoform X1 [Periplaneta americana]|uniref:facilitated trehalose transporter Tret1-like isoform X1 n=1 Tax=Periplaneta americana TaxID=6978 RepID=UPI0037E75BE8
MKRCVVRKMMPHGSKWPQRLAACLAALVALCNGSLEGWTSPALPHLQTPRNDTEGIISDDEASWIGSLAPLGALFGALPSGYLAGRFGRRFLLLLLTVPLSLGWITIILAGQSLALLYTARFILGLTMGATTVITPIYNEEIAEINLRGELGTYMDLSITIGILYMYAVGAFVPYIWLCILAAIIPVLFGITFFWMPESPVYLLSKGRKIEAEKSLCWLRNVDIYNTHQVLEELNGIQKSLEIVLPSESVPKSSLFRILEVVFGLMIFQQLSGINAVIFYTVDIFKASKSTLSPYLSTLIIGIVQVLATYIAALFMDHIGRRVLLILSDIFMAVCHLALAMYFYFSAQGSDLSSWSWVPLVALNVFIIAYSVGFGPIPWFMMVELSTNEAKGLVSALAVSLNWTLVFIVTKVFTLMLSKLGPAETYGALCVICVAGCVFVTFCVPETRGKTKEEIQNVLQKSHNVQQAT